MTISTYQTMSLDIDQIVNLILRVGHKRTVIVQGHIGTGKSSIGKMLSDALPDHHYSYFDCTTKDLGDLGLPDMVRSDDPENVGDYSTMVPNEELALHRRKPVIVNLDEFGKANAAVKQGLTRFMLERKFGSYSLPEGSIVFATTNLGAEGVGDLLQAHQTNRIIVVTLRKPTTDKWIEWGINNDIDHAVLSWVRETPAVMQDFTECTPDENPHIFHPQDRTRVSFVSPRSLETASDIIKECAGLDDATITSALAGAMGARSALDCMAYVKLANELPTLQSIKTDPKNAKVPTNAAAISMVVFRALGAIESDWVNNWVDYLDRLPEEAQAMFANNARSDKYSKRSIVMTSKRFTDWAMSHTYLYTADKTA